MGRSACWIAVGTEWITVCNGLWHSVFIANDRSLHPGPCTCGSDDFKQAFIQKMTSLLESDEEPRRTLSGSNVPDGGPHSGH